MKQNRQNKKSFEVQLTQLSLLTSLPLFLLLVAVMIYANISIYLILLTVLISSLVMVYSHSKLHQKSAYQFRSLSNLLDAMVQGDYSLRARPSDGDEALNELVDSINSLSLRLNKQRIETTESQLLLTTVINHIDVAILALNENNELVLTNPAAKKLLQIPAELQEFDLIESFSQFDQIAAMTSGNSQVMSLSFANQQGKFNVHLEEYRENGKPQKLVFITDVSTMLRSEEHNAWQALVRVISHEINNSLAPIASLSQSLRRLLTRQEDLESHKDYLVEGLSIISQRSNSLTEFVNSYKQIASLPEPKKQANSVLELVNKTVALYPDESIEVRHIDDITLFIDAVQFEQVLINLVKNAIEAIKNTGEAGKVVIHGQVNGAVFTLSLVDDGTGVSNVGNLFVPFYTTKSKGSGIGLVLCRQIIEAHGGKIYLTNRGGVRGCKATVELPL
jgi:nitrogen fixation/metabolism regulation signal transduction histidine kinase